jgi:cytochrome c biogenesis protein CcdA
MFDTINGLPVHALVIHAVVVLLPLMALVTIAFTVRAKWRPGLPWAMLGNLAATGAAYVAVLSGRNLQTRLSTQAGREIAKRHGELGAVLPYFGIGLVVASVLSYLLVGRTRRTRRSSPDWDGTQQDAPRASGLATAVAVVLVLAAGAAATTWTYRVGDSGAQEVWHDTIANTKAP